MRKTKMTLVGSVVAATAVLAVLGASPAQGAGGKGTGVAGAKVDQSKAPDRAGGAVAAAAPGAAAALAAIQGRVAHYVAAHGTGYTFASYLDSATGKIVLNTNAPAGVVSALTDMSGKSAEQRQAASQLRLNHAAVKDTFNRRDDIQPYWGGAGITDFGGICSAGYTVQNSVGTRSMVTAGHCFANGAGVWTESGANFFGTVSNRHLPTVTGEALDMELVGGQSYAGRIYSGGVTSTSSLPVVAAGTAFVGYNNYCHSGRTTGENCGHTATSISGQVCTQTGCKSPVIVFTGGNMIQGGDSGAPFYAKDSNGGVWIRGNTIATDGTTGYAEPWTTISPTLGVSIVTG
jgi:hypothetical protein